MEYPYIDLIPAILKSHIPSVYEDESFTTLEYVSKIAYKMNEVVDEFNSFVKSVCDEVVSYKECTDKDIDLFKRTIEQKFYDFVEVIKLKYQSQDIYLQECVNDIIASLPDHLQTTLDNMYKSGEFDTIVYNSIANLKTDFDRIVANNNTFQNNINKSFSNIVTEVTSLKSEINTSFEELEEEINQKFNDLQVETQIADMQKTVYDTNNNGVVDDAEKLGGQPPSYYAKQSELESIIIENDTIENSLNAMTSQVSTVQEVANSAKSIANSANTKADNATSNINNLNTRVDNINTLVNTAQSKADLAKTSADNAQTSANEANAKAEEALSLIAEGTGGVVEVIWKNDNSGVAYQGETLELSGFIRDNYKYFIVHFKFSTNSNTRVSIVVKGNGYSHPCYIIGDITAENAPLSIHRRNVIFNSSNKIVFGDAAKKYVNATTTQTDNEFIIPVEIWGIK